MPCLTNQSQDLQKLGPILEVVVLPSTAYLSTLNEKEAERHRRGHRTRLLIDTGAAISAIDQRIAQELGLKSHGTTSIATPSSTNHVVETFDIDLFIPTHQVHFQNRFVIASDFHAQGIDGLLGRDILRTVLLVYHGYTNQFTIAI